MATFADRLRELRQKKGLRQKDLAYSIGLSESAYGYYEQGRREPSQEALVKLAEILGTSVDYLLTGDEYGKESTADPDKAEFLRWVEENLEDSFFYDFHKSPEEQKEDMMDTLRMIWDLEKKRKAKHEGKE